MSVDDLLDRPPEHLVEALESRGLSRVCVVTEPGSGALTATHEVAEPIVELFRRDERDYRQHEAAFLAVGTRTRALLGAFVHTTIRGQGAGGLRNWRYETLEQFLRDGLRLSVGMTRKNALAGLWWGGGKGVIAAPPDLDLADEGARAGLYRDFGDLMTSIRGCYVTAEDVGTRPRDVGTVFTRTRFTTCIPEEVGGSGNPSPATAVGVVRAMEAALSFLGLGDLEGKRIALQGTGNVGSSMLDELLDRKVGSIVASEIDPGRVREQTERYADAPVEIRLAQRGDATILAEPCDVLAPNALGGSSDRRRSPPSRPGSCAGRPTTSSSTRTATPGCSRTAGSPSSPTSSPTGWAS